MINLIDLNSLADFFPSDKQLTKVTLSLPNEEVQLKTDTLEDVEEWKGFILTVTQLSVPSRLALLPGQIIRLREVLENENSRRKTQLSKTELCSSAAVVDLSAGDYVDVLSMPSCFHKVSRKEAADMLEQNPSFGNLILRPGSDIGNYAVSIRQPTEESEESDESWTSLLPPPPVTLAEGEKGGPQGPAWTPCQSAPERYKGVPKKVEPGTLAWGSPSPPPVLPEMETRQGGMFRVSSMNVPRTPIVKHYRVLNTDKGYTIELEKPVTLSNLEKVVEYFMNETRGKLAPYISSMYDTKLEVLRLEPKDVPKQTKPQARVSPLMSQPVKKLQKSMTVDLPIQSKMPVKEEDPRCHYMIADDMPDVPRLSLGKKLSDGNVAGSCFMPELDASVMHVEPPTTGRSWTRHVPDASSPGADSLSEELKVILAMRRERMHLDPAEAPAPKAVHRKT